MKRLTHPGHNNPPLTYKEAGVDIDAGDALVEHIKPLARSTDRRGVMGGLGGFGGLFDLKAAGFKDPILVSGTDGVGTKLKVAIEAGIPDTVGIDLVAMCVNDIVVQGAEPLFFLDYYATGKLEVETGRRDRRRHRRRLPARRLRADRRRDGGDARHVCRRRLRSRGLLGRRRRARRSCCRAPTSRRATSCSGWPRAACIPTAIRWCARSMARGGATTSPALLEPTRIYVKPLLQAIRATGAIKGLAHITGGGLPGNVPRCLPDGLRARLDARRWTTPPVFGWLQRAGSVPTDDMLRTFNCGLGMIVVVGAQRCRQRSPAR